MTDQVAVVNGTVYGGSFGGTVSAVDAASGNLLRQTNTKSRVPAAPAAEFTRNAPRRGGVARDGHASAPRAADTPPPG
ncbi:PQQ-binding-like beta-propeller repeat protein [Streptomyces sp. JJ38]|nr:PQQ-binding-like beta-propeller repeat protein [Streptomyces sp. JJ38]